MKVLVLKFPDLPKWPAMFVTGKSVTPTQAKDILFRTDASLQYVSEYAIGGNNRAFRNACMVNFGWEPVVCIDDISDLWKIEMGQVSTEYIRNDWLSSAYVFGPNGWCHPDGTIRFDGHNIGKWPSVEEVVLDWKTLLAAFPYLDLVCTLFDRESGEDSPVPLCTIHINSNDGVMVCAPDLNAHSSTPTFGSTGRDFLCLRSELGWPPGWVEEFGKKSLAVMKKLCPQAFESTK